MFGEPARSHYDISFVLFGFPVRVSPRFWVLATILYVISPNLPADMRMMIVGLAAWIVAVFLAIIVHELGHAFVQRAFGYSPWIVLHGFGGMAAYMPVTAYGRRPPGTFGNILISAAGPLAGFSLAAVVAGIVYAAGGNIYLFTSLKYLMVIPVNTSVIVSPQLTRFLDDLLWVSVGWGLFNLLPIYPLDGGHIARELLLRFNRSEGIRWSLMFSIFVAGLIAVRFLFLWYEAGMHGFPFNAMLFGMLAGMNIQTLQAYNFQRWR